VPATPKLSGRLSAVSLILHLSDLHLGSPSSRQFDSNDRFGLDPKTRETIVTHLQRTLRTLGHALDEQGRTIDAVVVSGDLTNANKQDGYDQFPAVLEELGNQLPDPDRILIVPGNHDADWDIQPGQPEKFKRFYDLVRGRYRSSLISGVDYDETTLAKPVGSGQAASPILELSDTTIVAINSADFCGVREQASETDWDAVLDDYLVDARSAGDTAALESFAQAESDLRRLRVQDMARIEPRQLDALREQFNGTSLEPDAEQDEHLRIAVLHHPIGPVSSQEEIKAFETMTNLETFRSFLFDKGFHVVLHGHKHESYRAWDWLLPAGDDLARAPWRTLVIGAPGEFRPGRIVCRLLEVSPDDDTPVPGAPRLRTIDVKGVRSAQTLHLDFAAKPVSLAQPLMHSTEVGMPWVVYGRTADAAYEQLRDLPTELDLPRAVVSVVEDASSTTRLPSNYEVDQDDEWLDRVVTWWQLARPEAVNAFAGSEFNHGQRLYGNGEDDQNTIKIAAKALPSSKAIALLVNAQEAGDARREYPALTAIQLQAREQPEGTLIDVVGIYRKQDLSRWWPVNMAELERIQTIALEAAESNKSLRRPVSAGRLIAQATIGLHDNVLPQMAGTVLDRAIDLDPDLPHRLALLAAQPDEHTEQEWAAALADIGSDDGENILVPSIGLKRLLRALCMHHELGQTSQGFDEVLAQVEQLAKESDRAIAELKGSSSKAKRSKWASNLAVQVQDVRAALAEAISKAGIQ
jgi:3',5'-cyclic AMP phosphodiesterase CpdA